MFGEDSAVLSLQPFVTVPESPIGALGIGGRDLFFAGIGRAKKSIVDLTARSAVVEVVEVGKTGIVFKDTLQGLNVPPGADWQPVEYLAVVQVTGLVEPPTLAGAGSGVEQVDIFFQDYIAKQMHLGERLAAGFYRIKIGP